MNIESVKSLFILFSGKDELEKYMPLISLAMTETEKMLISSESVNDVRIDFLCASIANYRLKQIEAACDRTESVYAGKMLTTPDNSGTLMYAEKLMLDYMNLCAELIKPKTFMFMSFGSGTENVEND